MLAICSGGSLQKSDHEQITPIALKKRATWVIHLWFERITLKYKQFTRKSSYFSYVLTSFHCFSSFFIFMSESLLLLFAHLLFFKERRERIAPVAIYKRATVRESLRSLMTKKSYSSICSFSRANCSFTHKNRAIWSKIYEQLPNPENYKPN